MFLTQAVILFIIGLTITSFKHYFIGMFTGGAKLELYTLSFVAMSLAESAIYLALLCAVASIELKSKITLFLVILFVISDIKLYFRSLRDRAETEDWHELDYCVNGKDCVQNTI